MSDKMVLETQKWLNNTYRGKTGYTVIPENGNTGWTTIYALLHALQIELGITATANNFGAGTISKFNARFPNGVQQQEYPSDYEDNIYGIIQGALWCKGYSTGADTITKHFYSGTGNAVKSLKDDAGLENVNSTVTLNVMKALMSMDQYRLVNGGTLRIQLVQRRLNRQYENYIGLCPCDGVYGRQMNKALIITLQAIEGFSVNDATGNFGNGTKARLPLLPDTAGKLSNEVKNQATDLVKYALICNGYSNNVEFDTYEWNAKIISVIKQFQYDMAIPQTGNADVNTWMSLLLSRGNPERACIACDTVYDLLDESRMSFVKNNGYSIIGRYINGTPAVKEFEPGEPKKIIEEGLSYFPIYQRNGAANLTKFTKTIALLDAIEASRGVLRNGVPRGSIVYFAVDFDVQDGDITEYIIPYFDIIVKNFDPDYKVGIYGTRNVCTRVMDNNIGVVTCFVSDMSTGYSGNMGFKMPKNWNLDQFYELKYKQPEDERIDVAYPSNFNLDRVAYSGAFPVVSSYEDIYSVPDETSIENKKTIKWFNDNCIKLVEKYASEYIRLIKQETVTSEKVAKLVIDALRSYKYDTTEWKLVLGNIDENFMVYLKTRFEDFESVYKAYLDDNAEEHLLVGNNNSVIDIAHLAATIGGYIRNVFPDFWTGWGGDLASAMAQVKHRVQKNDPLSVQDIAYEIVGLGTKASNGSESSFNYSDICSDADAIKISELISNSESESPVSDAITNYYESELVDYRFYNYMDDIEADRKARGTFYNRIMYMMEQERYLGTNVITHKGDNPSQDIIEACCLAFANYIFARV